MKLATIALAAAFALSGSFAYAQTRAGEVLKSSPALRLPLTTPQEWGTARAAAVRLPPAAAMRMATRARTKCRKATLR